MAKLSPQKKIVEEVTHVEVPKGPFKEDGVNKNMCRKCEQTFLYKIDLKAHIRKAHITYKPCRNPKTCSYNPCRFNHQEYPEGSQVCYECGNNFKSIYELMKHRKLSHDVVLCKQFLKQSCEYSSEDCYFPHTKKSQPSQVKIQHKQTNPMLWVFGTIHQTWHLRPREQVSLRDHHSQSE